MFKVAAPGSLMLMGEHAVLANKPALACAINKYINVTLTPDYQSRNIIICGGEFWPKLQLDIYELQITEPYSYVCSVIMEFKPLLTCGFELQVFADFTHTLGLGSSAAVTVAVTKALLAWLMPDARDDKMVVFSYAGRAIKKIAKHSSLTDVVASIFGGIIFYQIAPLVIKKCDSFPKIVVWYSGYKRTTQEVVNLVRQQQQQNTKLYQQIFAQIAEYVAAAYGAIIEQNWQQLGKIANLHYICQQSMGLSDVVLDGMIRQLHSQSGIFGAKISGAGLGDCVIGIGETGVKPIYVGTQEILVDITTTGACYVE